MVVHRQFLLRDAIKKTFSKWKGCFKNGRGIHDARKMAKLSNNLLNLAKASYSPTEIAFAEIRLDELLVDARNEVLKANPSYHITVQFDKEIEEGASVSVKGNEYLLKVAFINLMENGCKFSENKTCKVTISYRHDKTILLLLAITIFFSLIGIVMWGTLSGSMVPMI